MNVLEAEIAKTCPHPKDEDMVLSRLNLDLDSRMTGNTCETSRVGLCIDTETTGLDHWEHKVLELGIVAFEFDPISAEIIRVTDRYSGFEDPGTPIPEKITEITGITAEMVQGQALDEVRVNALAQKAHLVIAHNAAFDRKFVESRFPVFANIPWACTFSQIDWKGEGFSSRSLGQLLLKSAGLTIDSHRALNDAEGVLGLLLGRLPVSSAPIFRVLLNSTYQVTSRLAAVAAPFSKKDLLKERGYRWNNGQQGGSKAWWRDVSSDAEQEELDYLTREIYPGGNTNAVVIRRFDACARFSVRE